MRRFLGMAAFWAVLVVSGGRADALDIIWNGAGTSGFNTTEKNVINTAIEMWEHLIVDNNTTNNRFFMQFRKLTIDPDLFSCTVSTATDPYGVPIYAEVQFNTIYDSYLYDDPTPLVNSDDFAVQASPYMFQSTSYPSLGAYDFLTRSLHMIGIGMGFDENYDKWHYFDTTGLDLQLWEENRSYTDTLYHPDDLMNHSYMAGKRRLISDIDITAIARAYGFTLTPDLDRDHDVDTSDLTTFFQNFTGDLGAAGGMTHKYGDVDADGDVDTFDITFALQNFTGSVNSGPGGGELAATVPEPSSLVLLGLGLACLAFCCHRRRTGS